MNITQQPIYQKGKPVTKRKGSSDRTLDRKFRAWIRTQPSCVSGEFTGYHKGKRRNVAAHVRRASTSGTGFKPLFSSVPLTDAEHRMTHAHGESYYRPKDWWEKQAAAYYELWKKTQGSRIKL